MCPRQQLVSIEYLWDSLGRMVPWHCPRPPNQLQVIAVLQLVWNTILLFAIQNPVSPWWEDLGMSHSSGYALDIKPFLSYVPMTVCSMERNWIAFILAHVSVMICFTVNVAGCLQNGCWVSLKNKIKLVCVKLYVMLPNICFSEHVCSLMFTHMYIDWTVLRLPTVLAVFVNRS